MSPMRAPEKRLAPASADSRFELVSDFHSRKSNRKIFTNDKWPFLNGSDDVSTVEDLIDYFNRERITRPVFAMTWTMMTHYPISPTATTKTSVPPKISSTTTSTRSRKATRRSAH